MPAHTETSTAALSVEGMNCASCVAHVSKAARSLPGVNSVAVNLARGRATVTFNPAETSADKISTRISESGYLATPRSLETNRNQVKVDHSRAWLYRAIAGFALWVPVECAHWLTVIFFPAAHVFHWVLIWISLLTSTVCLAYVGASFYKSAWNALRHRTTNMDTLIAMGSSVAYFYSLVFLIGGSIGLWRQPSGGQLYFMESSALLALISLGHWLEANARRVAGSAIHALLELAPTTALRVREDKDEHRTLNIQHLTFNKESPSGSSIESSMLDVQRPKFVFSDAEEVEVSSLQSGDIVLVRPGDRVPIDGLVVDGSSSVDESMISGEPLPVTRTIGDAVIGGTINHDGRLVIRTTAVGADTALSQIVQLVEKSQESRPPVQRLADQIAAVFVPTVLGIALMTGIGWFAWGTAHQWATARIWAQITQTTCSVLLIACPCALGLAVPAAIMVGTGLAARRGILIRDIDALQKAEKIATVVLDKTGTITQGKPVVTHVTGGDEILQLATAAEQFSSHPIAKAIVNEARKRKLNISMPGKFNIEAGFGVTATVDGREILVGNEALMRGLPTMHAPVGTIVYVAEKIDDNVRLLGQIEITDVIKPDSIAAIARLHGMGLSTVLLTGDNQAAAKSVTEQVKIEQMYAEVRPGEKAAIIRRLQGDSGHRVAMVGDGINDAPALAQADLGIALGSGSDVAKEAGDIILISGSLMGVAGAIIISRATMRTIRQNLFFAFIYNVLAIPLAAMGFMHPIVAAGAMALSDVTVIGNSLRLKWVRISA